MSQHIVKLRLTLTNPTCREFYYMTNMLWAANSVTEQKLIVTNPNDNITFHSTNRLINVKAISILGSHPISDTVIRDLQLLHVYSNHIGLTESEKKVIVKSYPDFLN